MTPLVYKAREFAIKYHGEQMYGDKPYIYHLDAVASVLTHYGEDILILAYLHDVIEDTKIVSREEIVSLIKFNFGNFIKECTLVITDEDGVNRKERKLKTYAKIENINDDRVIALIVKGADRLVNIIESIHTKNVKLLKMYKNENEQFMKAVYRKGLAENIFKEINELISFIK